MAGPSQAEIECHDNGDGSALVKYEIIINGQHFYRTGEKIKSYLFRYTTLRYHPTLPGEYAIHILCDNEDISKSPFIAQIQPKTNVRPELISCYGAGIQPHGLILGCSTVFKINTKKAGRGPLEVHVSYLVCKIANSSPNI